MSTPIGREQNVTQFGQKQTASGAAGSGITAGMGAAQNSQVRPITVTPVDRKTIEGSTPGDFRSQAAPAILPDNPGPRDPKGQSKVMSSRLDSPAPQLSDSEGSEGERA